MKIINGLTSDPHPEEKGDEPPLKIPSLTSAISHHFLYKYRCDRLSKYRYDIARIYLPVRLYLYE